MKGVVIDETGEPVRFARIVVDGDTSTSYFSDIAGRFSIRWQHISDQLTIECTDHYSNRVSIKQMIADSLRVTVTRNFADTVKTHEMKSAGQRVIDAVVANDRLHDPEKQGSNFRYTTYSKSSIDLVQIKDHKISKRFDHVIASDSIFHRHHRLTGSQHVEVAEAITERYFRYPNKDHEKILGLKESGLHDKQLISLHSNRHAISFYDNYFMFLGTRYASPIGVETAKWYEFFERDRYLSEGDTIYVVEFRPIKLRTTGLKGIMHINSNQYAVQHILAEPVHNVLVEFTIAIKSEFIDEKEWFPTEINHLYYVKKYPKKYLATFFDKKTYITNIELDPQVDPDEYGLELVFMDHYATEQNEEFWNSHRIEPLTKRERKTYLRVDTLRHNSTIHNVMDRGAAFYSEDLYYRLSIFTLNNVFRLNRFEGVRLGLAATAGKDFLKVFEFNGYGAYGFRDEDWKWGAGGGFFLNEKKEMELKFIHTHDLREPGHINYLNKEKDFFRTIFTDRMDRVETNKLSYSFRSPGYHLFEVGLETTRDKPTYDYQFLREDESGNLVSQDLFHTTELQISTRYAVNEKISNMLGEATRLTSFSPIFYLNYSRGYDGFLKGQYSYDKMSGLMNYDFNIGHAGVSSLTLDAGLIRGNIPYPFLFNGKGGNLSTSSVIIEDHFQTMGLYEFVSDKYFNIFYSHNFGSKIFAHARFRPDIVIYQHVGWGSLGSRDLHVSQEQFPDTYGDGFYESGLAFNNMFKYNLFGKAYGGLGIGFFYRYGPHKNDGGVWNNMAYRVTYVIRSI